MAKSIFRGNQTGMRNSDGQTASQTLKRLAGAGFGPAPKPSKPAKPVKMKSAPRKPARTSPMVSQVRDLEHDSAMW